MAVAHRIYAKALFNAAKDGDRLQPIRTDFADLAEALEASPELRNLLRNPQIDVRAKKVGVDAVFAGSDEVFRNFLKVELTTAGELSDSEAAEIVEQIARASGRRVEATRSVDPSLIGGIVLQAGSFRADASVRGRLESLRQELVTR